MLISANIVRSSEFARDCISERGQMARNLALAEAQLFRATQELQLWEDISELNPHARMVSDDDIEDLRFHITVGDESRVEDWRRAIPRPPEQGAPSIHTLSSKDSVDSLKIQDSASVRERRPYERIRGRQWANTVLHRQQKFHEYESRTRDETPPAPPSVRETDGSEGTPLTVANLRQHTERRRATSAGKSSAPPERNRKRSAPDSIEGNGSTRKRTKDRESSHKGPE